MSYTGYRLGSHVLYKLHIVVGRYAGGQGLINYAITVVVVLCTVGSHASYQHFLGCIDCLKYDLKVCRLHYVIRIVGWLKHVISSFSHLQVIRSLLSATILLVLLFLGLDLHVHMLQQLQ